MDKIKAFIIKHETRLAIAIGFILVASISFEIGYIEGKKGESKPLVIEKTVEVAKNDQEHVPIVAGASIKQNAEKPAETNNLASSCVYVGSKNSNKVHLSTCPFAKRIKPENLVCFKSLNDAIGQGRVADKTCIK